MLLWEARLYGLSKSSRCSLRAYRVAVDLSTSEASWRIECAQAAIGLMAALRSGGLQDMQRLATNKPAHVRTTGLRMLDELDDPSGKYEYRE